MSAVKPSKPMVEVGAVIDAPVDKVWPLLRNAVAPTEVSGTTAAHQGGWWYRGEWTAAADGDTTVITHRVFNVAQRWRWGVPLANRFFVGFESRTGDVFAQTIDSIASRLGTTARTVPMRPANGTPAI